MGIMVKFADDELSIAELSAAVLDGDLSPVGEGFCAADAPETSWLRAASLRPMLGSRFAATHTTAAWVWGALAECPAMITAQRATVRRTGSMPHPRLLYRDGYVGADDLDWFGTTATTTITRTLADVARARDIETASLLLALYPQHAREAITWCETNARRPGAAAGIELLTQLM